MCGFINVPCKVRSCCQHAPELLEWQLAISQQHLATAAAASELTRAEVAGRIIKAEEGAGGSLPSTVASASWAFQVSPVFGWGDEGERQKATAGWLAALPVFEPHWQASKLNGSSWD